MIHPFMRVWCVALGLFVAVAAQAQFRVEVAGVGVTQLPIGFTTFRGAESSPQNIASIVAADLDRSGQFRSNMLSAVVDEVARPDLAAIKQANLDALVTGSVTRLSDGRFDVRFRLWDAVKLQDLGGQSFAVGTADLRLVAHRISDFIYEKLTGEKGVFSTRIAYVTKVSNRFHLWIADSDGQNAQAALTSPEPIISPSWSPNGRELAYVSFETRKPVVYVHDIATGRRRILANFKGSNSAPTWAPDGKSLAVTLTRDGGSQLFVLPAQGGEPRRLIQSSGIDTEPVFAPDGSALYFVSDRGGSPQIYRTPAQGGPVQRVTFNGTYNISPAISPDGKTLAFITRSGSDYKLAVMDLNSDEVKTITSTRADERPSFAPNGKLIVYATRINGQEALMTTTLDGKITARLTGQAGDIREPHWGPFATQ
jgi:TolB protein